MTSPYSREMRRLRGLCVTMRATQAILPAAIYDAAQQAIDEAMGKDFRRGEPLAFRVAGHHICDASRSTYLPDGLAILVRGGPMAQVAIVKLGELPE